MSAIVISGTGLYTPPYSITNEELVNSFNEYVELHNAEFADDIAPLVQTIITEACS